MKRIIAGIMFVSLFGCDDFLEEKSQSEVRPSNITDMEKIMEGSAYCTYSTGTSEGSIFNIKTEILTDDIGCVNKEEEADEIEDKEEKRWFFSWDRMMFDEQGGGEDMTLWTVPYEKIMGCNIVLDYMDEMSGAEDRKQYVKGEAYALRGFYYFMLVNFFGWPYNDGDPSAHLGVPLKLESSATDEMFTRNTVAEVYAQIELDLLTGAKLMEENPQRLDITRLSAPAAYALASRMYLYMEDWDNVIKYADMVLAEKADLLYLSDVQEGSVYDRNWDTEILWAVNGGLNDDYYVTTSQRGFIPSTELVNLYGQDVDGGLQDIRIQTDSTNSYFKQGADGTWIAGATKSQDSHLTGGIRTAEVYLNRAEAYVRKYIESGESQYAEKALADLNYLREYRFEPGYIEKELTEFADGEALLDFCLRERRREMVHEANSRWFDLRRLGMPRIEHNYYFDRELQVFTLEEKDSRYVLPIPERVIEQNPNLQQN